MGIALWARRNGPFEIWERGCRRIDPEYKLPAPFDDPNAWRTKVELQAALEEVGIHDLSFEEAQMPFPFESPKAFLEFWFEGKNPAPMNFMSNWPDERMEEARKVVGAMVSEYAEGSEIFTWAVLGVGRK